MVYFPCRNKKCTKFFYILIGIVLTLVVYHGTHNPDFYDASVSSKNSVSGEEEEEEWNLEEENVPELSMILNMYKDGPKGFLPNCARFPSLYDVQFSNVHWQTQETEAETYYFYSAYVDARGNVSRHPNHPYDNTIIRVLGMSNSLGMNLNNATLKVCQFWSGHNSKPVFGNITEIRMTWIRLWGNRAHYFPYLITCPLPPGLKELPISVSLVPSKCSNATNNLMLLHRERIMKGISSTSSSRKGIAVCVKALDFPDDKMRYKLIEWIETLRLLGADKIFFYEYFVDSEIKKLLDYYENKGIINVAQTTLPGELPNQPQLRHLYIRGRRLEKRLTELIPYNDCFYKNMYDFEYIAIMDTDEIIIPKEAITWSRLIELVQEKDIGLEAIKIKPVTTFCFENFYFLDEMLDGREDAVAHIPSDFHMLRHIYRSNNSTGKRYMKCFHDTDKTLGVHNHFAFFCREGKNCNRHYINTNRAQMNHYRSTCVGEIKNCSLYVQEAVKDARLWRYEDEIKKRVYNILKQVYV